MFTLAAILCMFLTGCHEFPFPATRGHLPRGATFAPNRRWPLVAGTTVVIFKYFVVGISNICVNSYIIAKQYKYFSVHVY